MANEQRAEVAARRAQAQAEASLRRAEAEYTAAAGLINSGKVLSDAYIESATEDGRHAVCGGIRGNGQAGPERAALALSRWQSWTARSMACARAVEPGRHRPENRKTDSGVATGAGRGQCANTRTTRCRRR